MPAERYFFNKTLSLNEDITIAETEFHHLVRVMRTRIGEEVEIVNGMGDLAKSIVKDIQKNHAILHIQELYQESPRSLKVILAQAIPKPNRLDFILEKGTELGVDEFWLFPGQLSVKKDFSESQIERMETQIITAMKQCGRLFLPKIIVKPSLTNWDPFEGSAFFGDTEKEAPLFKNILANSKTNSILFFIGPESGFSEKEIEILKKLHAKGVKLHSNILRTDTASLVALSLIEHYLA